MAYNAAMTNTLPERQIFTISQLNRRARQLLETHLSLLWARGEISNLSRPSSGHWYFTLKDSDAQIRCAMFKGRNALTAVIPKEGDQILVRGRVGLYEARGDYQLIVEHLEADGAGLLQQRYEALKQRLHQEGLFDASHKQPLPKFPRRIGIITSPTGAALRDILHVTARRCPWVEIDIYPCAVQGRHAIGDITTALALAQKRQDCDLLVLARGGGSIEDLWAFNEEAVARAIHDCTIPIVSAIGHETDFTIADFVADMRAPTPSAAAEITTPDRQEVTAQFERFDLQLRRRIRAVVDNRQLGLTALSRRLQNPVDRLHQQTQHLDHLEIRLRRAYNKTVSDRETKLAHLIQRFLSANPRALLERHRRRLEDYERRLSRAMSSSLALKNQQFRDLSTTLHAVSPLATLDRGYAIIFDKNAKILRTTAAVAVGDALQIRLRDGKIDCQVKALRQIDPSRR